jgi:N-acetylglucosaminyldiphosphoundecaprenol N-acetyl-beta-D-mannosaminyltransferase
MQSKNKNIDYDFNRKIWCILGLPFDGSTFETTLDFIDSCVKNNKQSVLSTLSVNFIDKALKDHSFRESIIQSDANVIDSTPMLWIVKFLGFPHKETITGSSLVQYLYSQKNKKKYSIFWFGGKKGTAEKAAIKTNSSQLIKAVGHHYPRFVSVKEMSTEDIIHKINKTHPNLLLIALGAKKGVAWTEKNKQKLNANVISHVGAAMNFIAGNLKRAPVWMQKIGLEWLWRIKEEPKLCKRYFNDGKVLLRLLITRIIPHKIFLIKNKKYSFVEKEPNINIKENSSEILIKIKGVCNNLNSEVIRKCFKEFTKKKKDVTIDFSETKYVDNSFLGLLLVLLKYQKINDKKLEITNLDKTLREIFKLNLLTYLLMQSKLKIKERK